MTDAGTPGASLTIRDNRTGQEYDVPIVDGTIRAADLGKIKSDDEQPGLGSIDAEVSSSTDQISAGQSGAFQSDAWSTPQLVLVTYCVPNHQMRPRASNMRPLLQPSCIFEFQTSAQQLGNASRRSSRRR